MRNQFQYLFPKRVSYFLINALVAFLIAHLFGYSKKAQNIVDLSYSLALKDENFLK